MAALQVQVKAAQGAAAPGNNANADILVLVTDPASGAGVASLAQGNFTVVEQFGVPGQTCGFSNNVTSFVNVGTGAYRLTVATHSANPPAGGCKWTGGDHLGQVMVHAPLGQGQAPFLLSVR